MKKLALVVAFQISKCRVSPTALRQSEVSALDDASVTVPVVAAMFLISRTLLLQICAAVRMMPFVVVEFIVIPGNEASASPDTKLATFDSPETVNVPESVELPVTSRAPSVGVAGDVDVELLNPRADTPEFGNLDDPVADRLLSAD